MPRLGHKKSRNGCRQCKARHVKCDENKPCSNCARHGVKCTLVTWDEHAPDPVPIPTARSGSVASNSGRKTSDAAFSQKSSSQTPTSLPIELVLNPSPSTPDDGSSPGSQDPFPYLSKFVHKVETAEPDIWLRDLELMHHWSTKAYLTMCVPKPKEYIWQIMAPQHAMTHTFLMHGLLAYSALHLGYLQPEHRRGYSMLSSHHQNRAIRAMTKALSDISAENCHALFATSALITLTSFATTTFDDSRLHTPIDDLLDLYALVQGMHGILQSSLAYLCQGPFSALLESNAEPHHTDINIPDHDTPPQPHRQSNTTPSLLRDTTTHLTHLSTLLTSTPCPLNPTTTLALSSAIHTLIASIQFCSAPQFDNQGMRTAFLWPIRICPNLATLLRQRHPFALAVLAHYCVVMRVSEDEHWAFRGWARRLGEEVSRVLGGGRGRFGCAWALGVVLGDDVGGNGFGGGNAEGGGVVDGDLGIKREEMNGGGEERRGSFMHVENSRCGEDVDMGGAG